MSKVTKEYILGLIEDSVSELLWYQRKDDTECPVGEIENAIKSGVLEAKEMVSKFEESLMKNLK